MRQEIRVAERVGETMMRWLGQTVEDTETYRDHANQLYIFSCLGQVPHLHHHHPPPPDICAFLEKSQGQPRTPQNRKRPREVKGLQGTRCSEEPQSTEIQLQGKSLN